MLSINVRIDNKEGLSPAALKAKLGLGKGGRVQTAIDKAVIDYCLPYVPYETGTLAKSAYTMTVPGNGEVI